MKINRSDSGLRNMNKGGADVCSFNPVEIIGNVKGKSVYTFCGTEQVSHIRKTLVDLGYSTRVIIWEKTNPSPMNGEHIWLSGIELCVYGKLSGAVFNAMCRNTVLKHRVPDSHGHPTTKPIMLMSDLCQVSSNAGDTILDPFLGSGTTLRAAKDLGRKAIGIEIEERYCEIAAKRLAQEVLPL